MGEISGTGAVEAEAHWAKAYVLAGLRWENGAQGPEAFDCWSFFRHVQRSRFGREVPIVAVEGALDTLAGRCAWRRSVRAMFASHPERARWRQVEEPAEGDAVLMRSAQEPSHIGVYVEADGGGVLHCLQRIGVCFDRLSTLRLSGWSSLEYWRGP